ncbi:hypothetical protein VKS41_001817 [Umbelopsis sp. WA50703]
MLAGSRLRTGVAPLHRCLRANQRSGYSTILFECRMQPGKALPSQIVRGLSTQAGGPKPPDEQKPDHTILTEYVSGRTRIFTSLPTGVGSGRGSKQSPSSPLTSPLSWQWLQPQSSQMGRKPGHWTQKRQKLLNLGVFNSLRQSMREMFLPVGYPESVHECYAKFHAWLFLETYVGSAIGVLCSQAMLASLGLGEAEAAGGAVAIQWVLKDGIGEVGKLFFIKRFASSFDSHPKTWKMVCEGFSSIGSALQLCTAYVSPKFFLPLAATGNMFELIHYSIWAASHMTFTRNFALSGNVGDIVAKDDAQMSTAHLMGMISGVGLISVSHNPTFLFSAFAILSPLNIWFTYKLLKTAQFEILNQAKLTLLSRSYIDTGKVVDIDDLKDREFMFGEFIKQIPGRGGIGVKIKLGAGADKAFRGAGEVERIVEVMRNENYLINYHNNCMWVMFHDDAESNDVIKSVLHSLRFHDILTSQNANKEQDWDQYAQAMKDSLLWTREKFPEFVASLDNKDWQSDSVYWNDSGVRVEWDRPQKTEEF